MRRLIPMLIAVIFTVVVAAFGNDVIAVYGGLVIFCVIYSTVIDRARRRGAVP